MADRLIDYDNGAEHTHAERTPPLVWALLVCVVVLAASVAALSFYLIGRAHLADVRNGRTQQQAAALRRSVCEVIDPIKAGRVKGVDRARALPFPVGAHRVEPLCPPLTAGQQGDDTRPTPRAVSPTPPIVATRTSTPSAPSASPPPPSHPRSQPHPTSHPLPRPTPRPTPSPNPKPSPTCLLIICLAR